MSMHEFDSNPNEAFNARMSHKAPKDRSYSKTKSLDYRVACARGENNLGQYDFHARVTSALGFSLGTCCALGLAGRAKRLTYQSNYKRRPKTKALRRNAEYTTMADLIHIRTKPVVVDAQAAGSGTYSSGMGVAAANSRAAEPDSSTTITAKLCLACGGADHQRRTSKKFPNHVARQPRRPAGVPAPSAAASAAASAAGNHN